MKKNTILQCTACDFRTDNFGAFLAHPCRQRQVEKETERAALLKKLETHNFTLAGWIPNRPL